MSKKYLADFLTYSEYKCSHCNLLPPAFYFDDGGRRDVIPEPYDYFFELFKEIRIEWGKALNISSGYRCPQHNFDIGGSLISAHITGLSMDLDVNSKTEVDILVDIINYINSDLRMGIYKKSGTFVHIDCAYFVEPPLSRSWVKGARWKR